MIPKRAYLKTIRISGAAYERLKAVRERVRPAGGRKPSLAAVLDQVLVIADEGVAMSADLGDPARLWAFRSEIEDLRAVAGLLFLGDLLGGAGRRLALTACAEMHRRAGNQGDGPGWDKLAAMLSPADQKIYLGAWEALHRWAATQPPEEANHDDEKAKGG